MSLSYVDVDSRRDIDWVCARENQRDSTKNDRNKTKNVAHCGCLVRFVKFLSIFNYFCFMRAIVIVIRISDTAVTDDHRRSRNSCSTLATQRILPVRLSMKKKQQKKITEHRFISSV